MESTILTQIVTPLCLFIIMFGMGLSLVVDDFTRVAVEPKAVLLGLFGQLILLPLFGFLIVYALINNPIYAVGIMLLAACPGGTVSNMISHLAKGDLALSITLTAISSLFSFVCIPLILTVSLSFFLSSNDMPDLPLVKTISSLFAITLFPISIGMLIRYHFSIWALRLEPVINKFALVFVVLLVGALIVQERSHIVSSMLQLGPVVLLLNIITISCGYILARKFGLNIKQTISISLEMGIQNSVLAILIATTILHSSEMAIPAVCYSLVMYFTGGLMIAIRAHSPVSPQPIS